MTKNNNNDNQNKNNDNDSYIIWIPDLGISYHVWRNSKLNDTFHGTETVPEWMAFGKAVLCQEDLEKWDPVDHFRSIFYLLPMWKLKIDTIAVTLYKHLDENIL